MLRVLLSLIVSFIYCATAAFSQSTDDNAVWVQLEAQPSLTVATERARGYADTLQDVNGFSLGGGWYAIALGPYRRADAENVLNVYRSEGVIPLDAYIATSGSYRSQFWPVGDNQLTSAPVTAPDTSASVATADPVQPTGPRPGEETVREARQSEAALTREERMQLQEWLQWAGFYASAIDGAFGRGTRASMAAWQRANNWEETGVLTTMQREELRKQFFAVLEGMNLQRVTSYDAGIEMLVPLGVVAQTLTEYPFVQFDATGSIPAKVLLISQSGDQTTLFGLYDIMQTLEIVPLSGERSRKDRSFVLSGANASIVSHTEVTLEDGEIKGFTLVWPAGDEERRTRILGEMQASFTRLDGTLDPAAGSNPTQDIDLLAGLQIRKPRLSRSGFFIDNAGRVLTTAEAVQNCTKITVERDYEMQVSAEDDALGVAILEPRSSLAPMSVAQLRLGAPRLKSDIAVSGYSYEGVLGAPTMTFGQIEDIKGLSGEQELARLALAAQPGDAGGPVFDAGGAVFGMLLPRTDGTQQLPGQVSFAVNADAIRAFLQQEGIPAGTTEGAGAMAPEDLTRLAGGMTVLVSCWN